MRNYEWESFQNVKNYEWEIPHMGKVPTGKYFPKGFQIENLGTEVGGGSINQSGRNRKN